MNDQLKTLSSEDAYSLGIARRRNTVVMLGVCGAVGLAVGIWSLIDEPHFNWLDTGILIAMLVAYLALTLILLLFPERSLHAVLLGWVITAAAGIGALVLSAYYGPPSEYILHNQIPWFIGWTPAVIIFAFTYLPVRTAQIISICFCVVTGLASVLFILLNLPLSEGESLIASMYMLMQFAMLNPMCVFLLSLLVRINGEVVAMVRDSYARVEQARDQADKAHQTDMLTGVLNRAGIDAQLQLDIDNIKGDWELLVVAASTDDYQEMVDSMGDEKSDALLCEIAHALANVLGPSTRLGRREGSHFIFWAVPEPVMDYGPMLEKLLVRLKAQQYEATAHTLDFSLGSTCARKGQKAAFVLEQANFNLFLARTREAGIVHAVTET